MARVELDRVVMRRMKEDDIDTVKQLITEGCEGTENRLILHILTRPLCLFVLAVCSSILRCMYHSFIMALAIPVFLLIMFLKLTMPHSRGLLGSSRPYWDYVGSSFRGTQDEVLENPYFWISGKAAMNKKPRRRLRSKGSEDGSPEKITPEREEAAGQVWVADCDGEILACLFEESEHRAGERRICRVVVGSWYRREGLGRLLVQSVEKKERGNGAYRLYAHVPFPSKVAEVFFKKVGYRQLGEHPAEEDMILETPDRGFLGYHFTKVMYKDL